MNENDHVILGAPDSDRVEKIAAQLLAQWFAAHCLLPEQAGKMVDSRDCVDVSLKFALELCEGIDRLDLPRRPADVFFDQVGPIVQRYLEQMKEQQERDAEALELFRTTGTQAGSAS